MFAASLQHDDDITHDKSHQPDHIPPNKEKGRLRHFQYKWFSVYPWHDYSPSKNAVFCLTCVKVLRKKLVQHNPQFKSNIIYDGFTRWKKVVEKFSQQENSSMHKESTEKFILLQQTPVVNQLNETLSEQQQKNDLFRYHDHISGNFDYLFNLRANDIPELQHFLKTKKNFAFWEIQNEVINDMVHSILRGLLREIKNRKEFSIIVDETRGESCKEQVPICIRMANSQILEAEEIFLGLYETSDITGKRLFAMFFVVSICHFKISRGQCYDGGSNMSGAVKGAQYYYCANHSLILARQDCVKNISLLRDCMQWVKEIDSIVKAVDLDLKETHYPKPLFPTRWTVGVKSITSVINSYQVILQFFQSLAESNEDVARQARGLYDQFSKGEVYRGLRICLELVFETESLSVVLQKKTMTVACASEAINVVLKCSREKMNEDGLNHLWSEMDSKVVEYEHIFPTLTRSKNTSAFASPEELYRKVYFAALGSITGEIQRRSEQTGYKKYAYLEEGLETQPIEWNSKGYAPCTRYLFQELENFFVIFSSHLSHLRSFSTLRMLKTYLRTTMTQKRLNSLCILHVYGKLTDDLNIEKLISEFINKNEYRIHVFGK
ncbi:hypothetical protein PR048_005124, partial [Dryococelus australis]